MRRLVALAGLCTLVLTITAPHAGAVAPELVKTGVEEFDLSVPAGAFCDFSVSVHVRQRLTIRTFFGPDGEPVGGSATGFIEAWVTNDETGTTVHQIIPGPSFFDATGALVRGTGPWSGILTVDGVAISAWGNISFNADSLVTAVRGRVEPLCPTLA
jgi:hypothetical protein